MDSDPGAKKKANVAGALLGSLVAFVLLGGFIYYKVTSALQPSQADRALAQDHARDEQRVQSAEGQQEQLAATLVELVRGVKADDLGRMLALVARPYRESMDPKKVASSLKANPYLKAGGTFVPRRTTFRDGTARWEGTFESSVGAVSLVADFTGEPAGWRLSGLLVGGAQTFPAF